MKNRFLTALALGVLVAPVGLAGDAELRVGQLFETEFSYESRAEEVSTISGVEDRKATFVRRVKLTYVDRIDELRDSRAVRAASSLR